MIEGVQQQPTVQHLYMGNTYIDNTMDMKGVRIYTTF